MWSVTSRFLMVFLCTAAVGVWLFGFLFDSKDAMPKERSKRHEEVKKNIYGCINSATCVTLRRSVRTKREKTMGE